MLSSETVNMNAPLITTVMIKKSKEQKKEKSKIGVRALDHVSCYRRRRLLLTRPIRFPCYLPVCCLSFFPPFFLDPFFFAWHCPASITWFSRPSSSPLISTFFILSIGSSNPRPPSSVLRSLFSTFRLHPATLGPWSSALRHPDPISLL